MAARGMLDKLVSGKLVVVPGDVPEVFEPSERALDEVSLEIGFPDYAQ